MIPRLDVWLMVSPELEGLPIVTEPAATLPPCGKDCAKICSVINQNNGSVNHAFVLIGRSA